MKTPKAGLSNHYKQAHRLLGALQGKPEVELLCMLALTVGTTSDVIVYNTPRPGAEDKAAGFAIANSKVKYKGEGTRAALLALRMLWFLKPDEFVWKKAKGVQEKKAEESTMYMRKSCECGYGYCEV
ncbi:hypothetical protein ACQKWADRAFT_325028 [Trichoderma austrokoningii]